MILSLSARRAWIEMNNLISFRQSMQVALRKESVDRNMRWVAARINVLAVALRKESVDRNTRSMMYIISMTVALRKESVDRNDSEPIANLFESVSLSARRAWIEIM